MHDLVAPLLVGFLWGSTNPLLKRGVHIAGSTLPLQFTGVSTIDTVLHHLLTPAFIIPQVLNLAGSVLFAACLASSSISLTVPLANGTSLAATALVGHLLGDRLSGFPGLPGVALLVLGVGLCSLSAAQQQR